MALCLGVNAIGDWESYVILGIQLGSAVIKEVPFLLYCLWILMANYILWVRGRNFEEIDVKIDFPITQMFFLWKQFSEKNYFLALYHERTSGQEQQIVQQVVCLPCCE